MRKEDIMFHYRAFLSAALAVVLAGVGFAGEAIRGRGEAKRSRGKAKVAVAKIAGEIPSQRMTDGLRQSEWPAVGVSP
ncbi:MAG: hypothetical protein ACYTG0_46155, partial [Planctomycetota bacterium]